MRGFLVLGAAYAGLWALLLAPGSFVMLHRARRVPIPDDDISDSAWVQRLRRAMAAAAEPGRIRAADVPLEEAPGGKRRRGGRDAGVTSRVLRVQGSVRVPDGNQVPAGLVVDGSFSCGEGCRIAGPVWATGNVEMGEGSTAASSVVSERSLYLRTGVSVEGGVAAMGQITLDADAAVSGPATSRRAIVLAAGARVGAALSPVVRGAPVDLEGHEIAPPSEATALEEVEWTPELDEALESIWPEGRIAELVQRFAEDTGVVVRGVHLMRRARELGLFARGLPRRPAVLGRRPAWVLSPDTVRVGADLRIPPGGTVSYTLVVEGALEVFQEAELEAPVRSGRGLLLRTGAVVYGQAASDGLIVCEEGTAILGPTDSSTHILLFANARIGLPGFGGAHALGAIGLEPGAEIVGGAVAGLGVRGEPLRPVPVRPPETGRRRRLGRRAREVAIVPEGPPVPADLEATATPAEARGGRRRARRRGRTPQPEAESAEGE